MEQMIKEGIPSNLAQAVAHFMCVWEVPGLNLSQQHLSLAHGFPQSLQAV
jgi:hypothetical protein